MRRKLNKVRSRITLALALVAMAGLTAISWWLTPVLWEMSPLVRLSGLALLAVLFALAILLIWLLNSDHINH